MKAISLWQPWASLIAIGAKKIETRSWSTPYRGAIAIHAAKRWTGEERDLVLEDVFFNPLASVYGGQFRLYPHATLPLGGIVAVVTLSHVGRIYHLPDEIRVEPMEWTVQPKEEAFGDYTPGRFAWVLEGVRRLPDAIPYRGQQGIWELESDVVAQIKAQLA